MKFSDFGKRFAGEIGIGELMDDLGDALVSDPAPLMLGGGNPAHIAGSAGFIPVKDEGYSFHCGRI